MTMQPYNPFGGGIITQDPYQGMPLSENMGQLSVTVIPLEPDLNPYWMDVVFYPDVDKNLKQIFCN